MTLGRNKELLTFSIPNAVLDHDRLFGSVLDLWSIQNTSFQLDHLGVDRDTKLFHEGVIQEAGLVTELEDLVLTSCRVNSTSLNTRYQSQNIRTYLDDSRGLFISELLSVLLWRIQHTHFHWDQNVLARRANMKTREARVLQGTITTREIVSHSNGNLLITPLVFGGKGHDVGRTLDTVHLVDTDSLFLVGTTDLESLDVFFQNLDFILGELRVGMDLVVALKKQNK